MEDIQSAILDSTGVPFPAASKLTSYANAYGFHREDNSIAITHPMDGFKHPGVWRCLNYICQKVAKTPLHIHTTDQEIDSNHLASGLIEDDANAHQSSYLFRHTTTMHAAWYGESLSYIVRDESARPLAMIPFHPSDFCVGKLNDGGESTTLYSLKFKSKWYPNIDPMNVYHLVGWTLDGFHAIPFWSMHGETIGLGRQAQKFAQSYYSGGANALAVIKKPPGLSPDPASEQHKHFINSFTEFASGFGKKNRIMFLENDADYQSVGGDDADKSQMHQAREVSNREIANLFGLPPFTVGLDQNGPYKSISEKVTLEIEALQHWFCLHENETRKKLLTERQKRNKTHYVSFDRDSLFDHETRINLEAKRIAGQLSTPNESRKRLNQPPVEGGDCILAASAQTPLDALCTTTVTTEPTPEPIPEPAANEQLQLAVNDADVRANQVIRRAITRRAKAADPVSALQAINVDKLIQDVAKRYSFMPDAADIANEKVADVLGHVDRITTTKQPEQLAVAIEATLDILLR